MLGFRIRSLLDSPNVSLYRGHRRIPPGLEILDEPRRAALRDVEDVVEDENLPIDMGASPDADYGDVERIRDHLTNFVRDALEQHEIGACVLKATRRITHIPCLIGLPALHLEPADLVNRLTMSTWSSPPSSLTIIAPPSCISRTALSSA